MDDYKLVVTKSTVPVGTAVKVKKAVTDELKKRGVEIPFDVASNPEFLKEGAAIDDFMRPDRIVVGLESERAENIMKQLYKPFTLNGIRSFSWISLQCRNDKICCQCDAGNQNQLYE